MQNQKEESATSRESPLGECQMLNDVIHAGGSAILKILWDEPLLPEMREERREEGVDLSLLLG